ncbi:hypothetical protein IQ249_20075 [Lusitaniella coriacea LEGE 07157]|uniref:Uncharacterized protein n=1 Tax=Lusitaniella coriacea LEGE 07157 TaxID=945747 RepID=A0A8J7JDC8_9CYAN|nr:hypothetical protein [Lusitaniella coriacea]MBE9118195.1 hypothetical protein [Lusitaniella coriacea LEGE 07157]
MYGITLEEIALYEVVGKSTCIDNIVIVPAFYEIAIKQTERDRAFNFSLGKYMSKNGYSFSDICPEFHKFSKPHSRFKTVIQCDAIWVRAKIAGVYQFEPPRGLCWRYELLNIPFLAVILDESKRLLSIHPFACVEEDLKAGLEFYPVTPSKWRLKISNVFWKVLLMSQKLVDFMDFVLGDDYDDYSSVVMGSDFVAGHWNNEFHLCECIYS